MLSLLFFCSSGLKYEFTLGSIIDKEYPSSYFTQILQIRSKERISNLLINSKNLKQNNSLYIQQLNGPPIQISDMNNHIIYEKTIMGLTTCHCILQCDEEVDHSNSKLDFLQNEGELKSN